MISQTFVTKKPHNIMVCIVQHIPFKVKEFENGVDRFSLADQMLHLSYPENHEVRSLLLETSADMLC